MQPDQQINNKLWNACHQKVRGTGVWESVEIANLLVDLDGELVNVTVNSQDGCGCTPLRYSCQNKNIPLSTVLLKSGAKPNLQSTGGVSAVHMACHRGPLELVKLLIRFGGNIHLTNKKGKTPLDMCASSPGRLSRHAIESYFYAAEQNWLRRESFAFFRSAIYGTPAFHARQMLLPEEERQKEVVVKSTAMQAWRAIDRVLGNTDLCRFIAQYL
jgi:hypothetical protein